MFPCYGHHGNSYSDQGAFNLMTLGDERQTVCYQVSINKKDLLFEEVTLLSGMKITAGHRPKSVHIARLAVHFTLRSDITAGREMRDRASACNN